MGRKFTVVLAVVAIISIVGVICLVFPRIFNDTEFVGPNHSSNETKENADQLVGDLIDNEVLIRKIKPLLKKIARSVGNLSLPSIETEKVFATNCEISGTFESDHSKAEFGSQIWPELFDNVAHFEQVFFTPVRILDRSKLPEEFVAKVAFEALAKRQDGAWSMSESTGKVTWQKKGETWVISKWDFSELENSQSDHRLFEDVATASIVDQDSIRHSMHYDVILAATRKGKAAFPNARAAKYSQHIPTGQHPSMAIVDVDQDGWDDIFLVEQWRENILLKNRGDGTFYDASKEHGLNISGHASSAIFADFDNDGDPDLILGQSLTETRFFENNDGRFEDASEKWFPQGWPSLVTSISAADYNNDGLLDVYLSTYGFPSGKFSPDDWVNEFMSGKQAEDLLWKFKTENFNRYLNALGPPNFLLENKGGRFELSNFNSELQLYLNTFQSTWCDYDDDGDVDLYVSNDFAQDFLFRNDQTGFTDVTLTTGDETMMGFGMGATWGDYDCDGRQDLYVSNMYSKAGLRIVEHFGDLDKRFRRSADGNRLYRNGTDKFELVSANESDGLQVHKAGWSWGGQFVDVNNDGFLDIYVVSGYFSAPDALASDKDL
ncbi:MAG: VCBS repeat-containing protein [Planctomycetota bacterium]